MQMNIGIFLSLHDFWLKDFDRCFLFAEFVAEFLFFRIDNQPKLFLDVCYVYLNIMEKVL